MIGQRRSNNRTSRKRIQCRRYFARATTAQGRTVHGRGIHATASGLPKETTRPTSRRFTSTCNCSIRAHSISTGQKLSKVIDGTSKTIVFSEVRTRDDQQDERGVWALPWNAASAARSDMHHDQVAAGGYRNGFVAQATQAILTQTQLPNTLGPNRDILLRCTSDTLAASAVRRHALRKWQWPLGLSGYISAAPRSTHVGGVNMALLDGHVGFLSNDVDPLTLAYLVDIRDAQVKSDNGEQ